MALIPFYKPTLRRKDMDAVLQTMVDERIGPGERKNAFLKEFCAQVGAQGGIVVRSFPQALRNALLLCQLPQGSTIGVSALSPQIYATIAEELGYHLELGDIDPEHGCLSVYEAKRLVEAGCSALLIHEPMCQIPHLADYRQFGVRVIEDISQSFASAYDDQVAGSWGDLILCSFEEDSVISTAGGAALVYKNEQDGVLLRRLFKPLQEFEELPDLNAALGIIQLAGLDEHIAKRREFHALFSKALLKTQHKLYGIGNIDFQPNGYGFCVILDSKAEEAIKFANKYQVSAKKTFSESLIKPFLDCFDLYPNAIPPALRSLSLPIYPFLKQSDVELLMKVISHLP
ncbi:DegT/DnrJ/EryC1/StrS family aminotransferase [Sphaerochaeta sp.]|uniref:DegT/DnrJ/EryC1/StrS family aminotransferase n=1 Tax=Sphaerochaeta sp. TaxID=1972642 RepID=UPI002FC5FA2A